MVSGRLHLAWHARRRVADRAAAQAGRVLDASECGIVVDMILAAAGTAAGLVIKDIARFTAGQHRRYKAWKQALPPEQRACVEAAATIEHQWEKAKHRHAEVEAGRAAGIAQVRQMHAGQWAQLQQEAALHDVAQQSGGNPGLLHQPNRSDIFGNLIQK